MDELIVTVLTTAGCYEYAVKAEERTAEEFAQVLAEGIDGGAAQFEDVDGAQIVLFKGNIVGVTVEAAREAEEK